MWETYFGSLNNMHKFCYNERTNTVANPFFPEDSIGKTDHMSYEQLSPTKIGDGKN